MSCIYPTISTYLVSKESVAARITAIDNLIDVMILSLADHAAGAGATISEYQLDDGQVKIRTGYRSIKEVQDGINSLEGMKQMYLNRYNGRVIVLRDEKTFRR